MCETVSEEKLFIIHFQEDYVLWWKPSWNLQKKHIVSFVYDLAYMWETIFYLFFLNEFPIYIYVKNCVPCG